MEFNQEDISNFFKSTDLEAFRDIEKKKRPMTEDDLFQMLCDEVAQMIATRMEYLLSLMYRLDVLEKDINVVLTPGYPEPVNVGLARLILERQKQRMASKKSVVIPPITEEGWEW